MKNTLLQLSRISLALFTTAQTPCSLVLNNIIFKISNKQNCIL